MKIWNLPTDLIPYHKPENPFLLHSYRAATDNQRNKITLKKNVFSFLIAGTKQLIYQNNHTKINHNRFLLIKSGNCLMTEQFSEQHLYRSLLLFFDDEKVLQFIEKQQIQIEKPELSPPFLVFEYDDYLRFFVNGLQQIQQQPQTFQQEVLPLKFAELLHYLIQKNGTGFLNPLVQKEDSPKTHFINIVESNIYNNLSIEELAFLCKMSESTFKRYFKKYYETSPIKWFTQKRLEHAANLMKNQAFRPSDIYFDCGYESLSSFIQAFKKQFGTTPKQFILQN